MAQLVEMLYEKKKKLKVSYPYVERIINPLIRAFIDVFQYQQKSELPLVDVLHLSDKTHEKRYLLLNL